MGGRSSAGVRRLHGRRRRRAAGASPAAVRSPPSSPASPGGGGAPTSAAPVEPRPDQLHQQAAHRARERVPLQQVPDASETHRDRVGTRTQRNAGLAYNLPATHNVGPNTLTRSRIALRSAALPSFANFIKIVATRCRILKLKCPKFLQQFLQIFPSFASFGVAR